MGSRGIDARRRLDPLGLPVWCPADARFYVGTKARYRQLVEAMTDAIIHVCGSRQAHTLDATHGPIGTLIRSSYLRKARSDLAVEGGLRQKFQLPIFSSFLKEDSPTGTRELVTKLGALC